MLWYYWEQIKSYLRNEKGQGMVEYGLILALVAVAVTAGFTALAGDDSSGLMGLLKKVTGSL